MSAATYSARLGIAPPRVEDAKPRASLLARMVIALVEQGEPMSERDLARRLLDAGVAVRTGDMVLSMQRAWHGLPPIYREPDGRYGLDLNSDHARYLLSDAGFQTPRPSAAAESETPSEREAHERAAAAALRRAIVCAALSGDASRAIAVADLATRETWTFVGDEVDALPERLASYDVLAGPGVRTLLTQVGLDADRWRLASLDPPQKTMRLNKAGRALHITPGIILSSTVGSSLGDPAKLADYLRKGNVGKLRRRLEADAHAWAALYTFGMLHHVVRLRWGFLDETLRVTWALPGDRHAWDLLEEARTTGREVDIVLGSAPSWTDPWSRARRVRVLALDATDWTFEQDGHAFRVPRYELAAVRIAS